MSNSSRSRETVATALIAFARARLRAPSTAYALFVVAAGNESAERIAPHDVEFG